LELGSEELINDKKAEIQAQRILDYLTFQDVVSATSEHKHALAKPVAFYDEDSFRSVYAKNGGLYEWFLLPGETFVKDQVIGQCLQMAHAKAIPICYPFDGLLISINGKGALQQGSHLLNVINAL
jgi:hypothetical protein